MLTPYYRNDDYETKLERILKAFKADEIELKDALQFIRDVTDTYDDENELKKENEELRNALDEISSIANGW